MARLSDLMTLQQDGNLHIIIIIIIIIIGIVTEISHLVWMILLCDLLLDEDGSKGELQRGCNVCYCRGWMHDSSNVSDWYVTDECCCQG